MKRTTKKITFDAALDFIKTKIGKTQLKSSLPPKPQSSGTAVTTAANDTDPENAFMETMTRMESLDVHAEKLICLVKTVYKEFPSYGENLIADARVVFMTVAGIVNDYNQNKSSPDASGKIHALLLKPNLFIDRLKENNISFAPPHVETADKANALAHAISSEWERMCAEIPEMHKDLQTEIAASAKNYKSVRNEQKKFIYAFSTNFFSAPDNGRIKWEAVKAMDDFNAKTKAEIHSSLQAILKFSPAGMRQIRKDVLRILNDLSLCAPALPNDKDKPLPLTLRPHCDIR